MYRLSSTRGNGHVRLFNPPGLYSEDRRGGTPLEAFGPLIRDTEIVMYLRLAPGGMGTVYLEILWNDRVYVISYENLGKKIDKI